MLEQFFLLGTVTKHFGYQGEVFVYLDTDEPEKYQTLESVFFLIEEEPIPFFIESFHYRGGNLAVVKFQDTSFEASRQLIKLPVYLPLSMLPKLEGNKFYYHEVKGFKVIDAEKGYIGACSDFLDYNQNSVMQVFLNDKEILIPVVDEVFKKVDRANQTLYIEAPHGLIEIYL